MVRFERAAKLLASLNHPNIAAIHGFEEDNSTHFLVLERVEGDALADRLKRGVITVEDSLKLALQIAEALEAAHEKGVICRDLRLANVNVNPRANGTDIFTNSCGAEESFQSEIQLGMVGINIPIPVPTAFYRGGWKNSLFADTHDYGWRPSTATPTRKE